MNTAVNEVINELKKMESRKNAFELGFLTKILYKSVRLYQHLSSGRPTPCKYIPTCSNYAPLMHWKAMGQLMEQNLFLNDFLVVIHLLKSNGWDPVPAVNKNAPFAEKVSS